MNDQSAIPLSAPIAHIIEAHAQRLHAADGQVLARAGQDCQGFMVVVTGCIRVFARSSAGREIDMYRIHPGETCVLTTSCLMAGEGFPAEAIAEEDTELWVLPVVQFRSLMDQSDVFRHFVFSSYGSRLTRLLQLVQSVAFDTIEQRINEFLLGECRHGLVISMSHQQIADALGSAREVISRQLKTLEKKGVVALARGQVVILDYHALVAAHKKSKNAV